MTGYGVTTLVSSARVSKDFVGYSGYSTMSHHISINLRFIRGSKRPTIFYLRSQALNQSGSIHFNTSKLDGSLWNPPSSDFVHEIFVRTHLTGTSHTHKMWGNEWNFMHCKVCLKDIITLEMCANVRMSGWSNQLQDPHPAVFDSINLKDAGHQDDIGNAQQTFSSNKATKSCCPYNWRIPTLRGIASELCSGLNFTNSLAMLSSK